MPKTTIKQHDITDCGAACLASVAAHYKLALPIARIRQYAGTDKKGTNILGMERLSYWCCIALVALLLSRNNYAKGN